MCILQLGNLTQVVPGAQHHHHRVLPPHGPGHRRGVQHVPHEDSNPAPRLGGQAGGVPHKYRYLVACEGCKGKQLLTGSNKIIH